MRKDIKIIVDNEKIEKIGFDGVILFIKNFSGGEDHIYRDLENKKVMNKIKVSYRENSENKYYIELKEIKEATCLYIKVDLPLFFADHNLYFLEIKKLKEVLLIVKQQLQSLGFETDINDYEFYDLELGINVINSNLKENIYSFLAKAINKKYKIFGTSLLNPFLKNRGHVEQGYSSLRGFNRFKIYNKTDQMFEKYKILIDKNVVRIELMFSQEELEREIFTNNCLIVASAIKNLLCKKLEKYFNNVEKLRERSKRYFKKDILEFKSQKLNGLTKEIEKYNYFDKEDLIEVFKMLNKKLNWNSYYYIKKIEKANISNSKNYTLIKEKLLFFTRENL